MVPALKDLLQQLFFRNIPPPMFHVEHQIRSLIFELAVSNEIAATYFTFSHFFSCSLLSIARSSSGRFQTLSASHDSLFHVKYCSPVCSLSERIMKTYVNMHSMTNNNLETDQETPHSKGTAMP